MAPNNTGTVLVTGGNGFVGMHCILKLLQDGYRVRSAVRKLERGEKMRKALSSHVSVTDLSLVEADLGRDEGWDSAMRGCEYVLHVASPVPRTPVRNAEEVIGPAREGTLRVMKAAAQAGVRRVVMTSSTAAVLWGQDRSGTKVYDERDWTILNSTVAPYEQSKTLAERAAWEFVENLPAEGRLELVTLLPGVVLGPVLGDEFSISGELIRKLMTRELPAVPALGFAPVDVRDVAHAHVTAMTSPDAAGQRFILALEHTPWRDMAAILAKHYNSKGFKIPTKNLPSWLLKIVALFDRTTAVAVPELGKR